MKRTFILGLASAAVLTFSISSFAASQVTSQLKSTYKGYESGKKANEMKEVLTKKDQFDSLATSTARRISKNVEEINLINSGRTSANSLKEYALRGQNEIDAIEALIQADKTVKQMENASGLKAEDKAEIASLKSTILIQSELMSLIGENPVINGNHAKSNEALSNLLSFLPRLTTEFKAEEREGYHNMIKTVIKEIKKGEIPADALRKALNDDTKLEQLRGCKA